METGDLLSACEGLRGQERARVPGQKLVLDTLELALDPPDFGIGLAFDSLRQSQWE
jgi:hypothetical protein